MPPLRRLARTVIQRQGYRVYEAASGTEALAVWKEHGPEINLLLTDMVMPGGMTGIELAAALKKRPPGLKVIFTSGYCAELAGKEFSHDGKIFLPKPYQPQMVAQLVRKTLDAPAEWRSPVPALTAAPSATHLVAHASSAPLIPGARMA